nr:ARF guanine-nucleotide exchange factor GNL2 [Tanacetum cinerariifolium]
DVPAGATAVALLSILKIVRLDIFNKKTPGAREAMSNVVMAVTGCRLEKTHPVTEAAVKMRILLVLASVMRHPASVLLNDHAVCTIVNTCFQVVQQSPNQGDLLQRTARHTMHDLIQIIFSRFPYIEVGDWEDSDSDTEDTSEETGYGIRCAVDIFHFLCSLLNVVGMVEADGSPTLTSDEDVQVFALVLINSALELSGDSIRKHYKLLRMVKDDLFHHLIHYGTSSSPLVLSMICSTVLNIYYFHRDSIRLQLEAFFSFVLFKTLNKGSNPPTSLQLQAFDGLMVLIHNIDDNLDKHDDTSTTGPYPVEISKYKPFWEEIPIPQTHSELETWIDSIRARKAQKRKMMVAGSHFNRDD